MKNPKLDIYTSDGRINLDKAFALIRETMKTLTPEEFRRINSTPFEMRGTDNGVVRTFPEQNPVVESPPPAKSGKTIDPMVEKKSRVSGRARPKAAKKASS